MIGFRLRRLVEQDGLDGFVHVCTTVVAVRQNDDGVVQIRIDGQHAADAWEAAPVPHHEVVFNDADEEAVSVSGIRGIVDLRLESKLSRFMA